MKYDDSVKNGILKKIKVLEDIRPLVEETGISYATIRKWWNDKKSMTGVEKLAAPETVDSLQILNETLKAVAIEITEKMQEIKDYSALEAKEICMLSDAINKTYTSFFNKQETSVNVQNNFSNTKVDVFSNLLRD